MALRARAFRLVKIEARLHWVPQGDKKWENCVKLEKKSVPFKSTAIKICWILSTCVVKIGSTN